LKKGREEQTDNEKGKRREQKALAVRRGKRMRNVCAVLGGGVRCVFGWLCVSVCMWVLVLALSVHCTDGKE